MADGASRLSSKTRRRLLQSVAAFFLTLAADIAQATESSAPTSRERLTLACFLDVLLPRDALTGSATDLLVDGQVWELAAADPQFRRLLALGCQWLDMTGGPPFHRLDAAQQEAVVEWMSGSDWSAIPRRFYELVRQLAVTLYYADPRSWRGLPLERPPQPLGYPPPWM